MEPPIVSVNSPRGFKKGINSQAIVAGLTVPTELLAGIFLGLCRGSARIYQYGLSEN